MSLEQNPPANPPGNPWCETKFQMVTYRRTSQMQKTCTTDRRSSRQQRRTHTEAHNSQKCAPTSHLVAIPWLISSVRVQYLPGPGNSELRICALVYLVDFPWMGSHLQLLSDGSSCAAGAEEAHSPSASAALAASAFVDRTARTSPSQRSPALRLGPTHSRVTAAPPDATSLDFHRPPPANKGLARRPG